MNRIALLFLVILLFTPLPAFSRTLLLEGRLDTEMTVREQITFGVEKPINELTYRYPLPARVAVSGFSQKPLDNQLIFTPKPDSVKDETDQFGNRFKVVTWKKLTESVTGEVVVTVAIAGELKNRNTNASFPLKDVPKEHQLYLKPTKMVQSDNGEILAKAKELTAGIANQPEAVNAIINFVTDHITYETPPKSYDSPL